MLLLALPVLLLTVAIGLRGSGVTVAAYGLIENAGSALIQRPTMNFTSGCTPTDNAGANRTDINCSSGGSPVAHVFPTATSSNGTAASTNTLVLIGLSNNGGSNAGGVEPAGFNNDYLGLNYNSIVGAGTPGYVVLYGGPWTGGTVTLSAFAAVFHPSATTYTFTGAVACYTQTVSSSGNNNVASDPTYGSTVTITLTTTISGSTTQSGQTTAGTLSMSGCSTGNFFQVKIPRSDSVATDQVFVNQFILTY